MDTMNSADTHNHELECAMCLATFESKESKRVHMREDWHVYNLKRRIASLPPISRTIFETQVQILDSEDEDFDSGDSCGTLSSTSHSEGEEEIFSLQQSPSQDSNLMGEEEATPVLLPGDELRLPSGKILGHRSHARHSRRSANRTERSSSPPQQLLTEGEFNPSSSETRMETMESQDRRLAMRNGTEMSLAGVPELQQRALMAVEKKMEGLAARARNEYQAGLERGGNKQKRFRVKSIGKKAGGLEKRNG